MTCSCKGSHLTAVGGAIVPCPNCVIVPATAEIQALAKEWLGFNPWKATRRLHPEEDVWRCAGDPVLDLHLPAGRDLAVRVLAARWVDDEGKRQYSGADVAILICAALDGEKEALLALPEPWRDVVAHVPYPAPSEVRIALALRGCLEIDSHTGALAP